MNKKIFLAVMGGLLILAVGAAALVTAGKVSASGLPVRNAESAAPAFDQHGGPRGGDMPGKGGANDEYLAQALGITVEELQAAQQAAYQKAIDLALEKGLITQAQADQLKAGDQAGMGRGGRMGMFLLDENAIDMEALLAEELGISVEELQAAREKAFELELQARLDSGDLTQEQADLIKAQHALRDYIDREKLSAAALGMTVEEMQAARQEGQEMADLLEAKGMTQEEYQAAYKAAFEAAVKQAVADGVITQAQADLVLANMDKPGRGGMPGIDGGRPEGGRGGHGGPADGCNCDCDGDGQPDAQPDSQDNG